MLAAQLFPDEAEGCTPSATTPCPSRRSAARSCPTLADAYAAGAVTVLSSVVEGFPISLVEAMFCGRATVSTDVGAVVEVIGGTGLVVPPRNPRALAEACVALLRDPERRERLGAAARARALELFTVEQNITAFHGIYLEIVSHTPVRRVVLDDTGEPLPFATPAEAHVPGRWTEHRGPRGHAGTRHRTPTRCHGGSVMSELGELDRPGTPDSPGAWDARSQEWLVSEPDTESGTGAGRGARPRRTPGDRYTPIRPPTAGPTASAGPPEPATASTPRRTGGADPVKALMHRHRELCERAVDPLEIAAGLEAHGVTDRTAARFRHRDVFSLAEEMYARIPRDGDTPKPRATPEPPPRPRADRALLTLLPGALCTATVTGLHLTHGRARPTVAVAGALAVVLAMRAALARGPLSPRPGTPRPHPAPAPGRTGSSPTPSSATACSGPR